MFSKEFVQAIHTTWQSIGPDLLSCYAECDESPDNEAAVEACLDADRIIVYGGKNGHLAQDEFISRISVVGYGAALTEAVASLPCPLV